MITALSIDPPRATRAVAGPIVSDVPPSVHDWDPINAGDDILLEASHTTAAELPCRVQDADLWFAETAPELDQAKAFCVECPARRACLAGALARREPWGVWGGEIFERGVVIARKRPRGRPRKDAREIAA